MRPVLIAIAASLVLVGAYVAAGGASYSPRDERDPCKVSEWRETTSLDDLAQQLALSGLDGAACDIGTTREQLARALSTDEAREDFREDEGITESQLEDAVRAGLSRIIDDAESSGELSSLVATGLRGLVRVVPAQEAFSLLLDARPLIEDGLGFGFSDEEDEAEGDEAEGEEEGTESNLGLGDLLDAFRGE